MCVERTLAKTGIVLAKTGIVSLNRCHLDGETNTKKTVVFRDWEGSS